jgi:hypothetical protein
MNDVARPMVFPSSLWPQSSLLARLKEPDRQEVLSAGTRAEFPSQHVLIRQGAQEDYAVLLTKGLTKVVVDTENGHEALLVADPAIPGSDPLEQQAPTALIAVLLVGLPALSLPLPPLLRHLPGSDEFHPGRGRAAHRALRSRHHPHRHGGNCGLARGATYPGKQAFHADR